MVCLFCSPEAGCRAIHPSLWHSLDINYFQSAVLFALCLLNGLHCLDPDMMTSLHDTKLNAIFARAIPAHTATRRPLAHSYIPALSLSVSSQCCSQADGSSCHEHVTPLLRDLHWLRLRTMCYTISQLLKGLNYKPLLLRYCHARLAVLVSPF